MSVKLLKKINKLFKLPKHPFNMQNEGEMTYAMWQYTKGEDTIKFYLEYTDMDTMFGGKDVLDVGCGAGGKSLYYLSKGAESVTGMDVVEKYEEESMALAAELGLEGFKFICCDAARTGLHDASFDTVIMNDAMEHVADPGAVLAEVYRILKPGGRLYVNFPPYDHPFGAHLSDVIGIPWVHRFFSDKTLIAAYKDLVSDKPDAEERIKFRFSTDENGKEYISYINKMTIKRFRSLVKATPFNMAYYKEVPLRNITKPICKIPGLKDFAVKMVVAVLEK